MSLSKLDDFFPNDVRDIWALFSDKIAPLLHHKSTSTTTASATGGAEGDSDKIGEGIVHVGGLASEGGETVSAGYGGAKASDKDVLSLLKFYKDTEPQISAFLAKASKTFQGVRVKFPPSEMPAVKKLANDALDARIADIMKISGGACRVCIKKGERMGMTLEQREEVDEEDEENDEDEEEEEEEEEGGEQEDEEEEEEDEEEEKEKEVEAEEEEDEKVEEEEVEEEVEGNDGEGEEEEEGLENEDEGQEEDDGADEEVAKEDEDEVEGSDESMEAAPTKKISKRAPAESDDEDEDSIYESHGLDKRATTSDSATSSVGRSPTPMQFSPVSEIDPEEEKKIMEKIGRDQILMERYVSHQQ
jgi:hypothetical protein